RRSRRHAGSSHRRHRRGATARARGADLQAGGVSVGILDRILSTGRSRVPSFGYRPDPIDNRDRMLASLELASDVPLSATVIKRPLTIKSQGSTGSCVGQSVAQAVQLAFAHDDAMVQDLSALFVYYNSRKESGDDTITDNGTYLRTAIKSVQKFGV